MGESRKDRFEDSASASCLHDAIETALDRRHTEHSLLYVSASGLDLQEVSIVHSVLSKMTRVLGGPTNLFELGEGNFAFFMEGWPSDRGMSVARLVRTLIQGAELGYLQDASVKIGLIAIESDAADVDELLDRAYRACQVSHLAGGSRMDIVRLEHRG